MLKITGKCIATSDQMIAYIKKVNPSISSKVIKMIPHYISEGNTENIRGDIAFAQSCLETGNFTFKDSAVTLDQNNFAGIGVTKNGMKGNSWDTAQLGIRAQIQHLKAYANTFPLVNECVDPRFKYVTRGCAEYVEWLGIQENPIRVGWASGSNYGVKIINILNSILAIKDKETTNFEEINTVTDIIENEHIKNAQKYLNKYFGFDLEITGTNNTFTKKVFKKALQKSLNVDYGCNLVIDGKIGVKTQRELKKYLVQKGSIGTLVTIVEIGMLLNKINPFGVEYPGSFGNGLDSAVRKYQKNKNITVDGIVGFNTFMELIN